MESRKLVASLTSLLRSQLPKDFDVLIVPLTEYCHVPISYSLDSIMTIQLTCITYRHRICYEKALNIFTDNSLLMSRLIKNVIAMMLKSKINCLILEQADLLSKPTIYCTDCHAYIREETLTISSSLIASIYAALVLPGSYLKHIPNRLKTILDLGSQGYSKISMSIEEAIEISHEKCKSRLKQLERL